MLHSILKNNYASFKLNLLQYNDFYLNLLWSGIDFTWICFCFQEDTRQENDLGGVGPVGGCG